MPKKPAAIEVKNIHKKFDQVTALKKVSFKLPYKKVTALIGPNGSGKTTLLKILVGLHRADRGTATIAGHNIAKKPLKAKENFGYIPDNPEGFDYLTGHELLSLTASLRNIDNQKFDARIKNLIKDFSISSILDEPLSTYSRGNRQKLAFISAILGKPKILVVDEPIVGLDPDSIEVFGEALKDFAKQGGCVLFSTHILEFGKRFADHVLVMHKGEIKLDQKITQRSSLNRYYQKLTK